MAFTFRGTYTKNRGDAPATGTVEIFSKRGVSLDSAELDENGSYELEIDAQEGEVKVVETFDGVEERSYPVSVSRNSVTDTSRDIGYLGPAAAAVASVAAEVAVTPAGGIAATDVQAALEELDTDKATTASVDAKADALVAANIQTDDYTLVLSDANKVVEMDKGTAVNLTVPLDSSVAFPVGTVIEILQYGAGQVTVVETEGVTVVSKDDALKLTGQRSAASLRKRATDEWVLQGDLAE